MSAYIDKPVLKYVFNEGQYTDFTPEWYGDIGNIIMVNLLTIAAYPVIETIMYSSLNRYSQMRDQKLWNPFKVQEYPKETNCSNVTQYY